MNTIKILVSTLLFGTVATAQTLADAVKKTENERFDVAGAEFRALLQKEPTNATNYFFYGENFCAHDDLDSANIIWKKGVAVDPANALNYVGLGKYLWFKGDTTAANAQLQIAAKMSKKGNPEVFRQTAAIYIRTPKFQKLDAAIELLERAIKLDAKNPDNYLLMGDAWQEKSPQNGSPAIKNYNLALQLNPKSPKAIVLTAKLYQRSGNDSLANVKYKEAQSLDPTYAPAYRENAELNMKYNQSSRAVENWKKYLALNNSTEARYRFATSLFSGSKYCEAINELLTVKREGFSNFYVERMLMYSYYECGDKEDKGAYQKGMAASDRFFAIAPKKNLLASDYKYKGQLYSKMGNDSLAIVELEKAVALDPVKNIELMGDIAKMHMKVKDYSKAITAYLKKANGSFSELSSIDLNDLGKAYYFGPKDYVMADSAYAELTLKSPSFSPAYVWRARSRFNLDPTNANYPAKDHYIKYLEVLTPEDMTLPSNKSTIIEASKYLGDYYVNSKEGKDFAKAKLVWNNVKTLDPADKQAAAFYSSPAGK
jgi:tetratricopeptide (TPR) repeat protein